MNRTLTAIMFFGWLSLSAIAQNSSSASAQPKPCTEPQQKQFEFWIGEWELTWPGTRQGEIARGSNSIHETLDGCVVEENFSGGTSMPLRGMSISRFDPRAGKWKQTWVDNQGGYLDFAGEFTNGQMILARTFTRPDGTRVQQRMVYKNIQANKFDWSWESSKDDGKTWQVIWPIHYKRKTS
jgi:hypothetical protein